MTTPLDNIISILLPGSKQRDTTEERFQAIWGELKLLGWKAMKSARYEWVNTTPYNHATPTPVLQLFLTLGVPDTRQHRVDVCLSCRRGCSEYGAGHVQGCRCGN
jgi:hypothetical protein